MRKEADFEVTDHVNIYQGTDDKIAEIIKAHADEIKAEVLADNIFIGQMGGYAREWNINGETVMSGVEETVNQ